MSILPLLMDHPHEQHPNHLWYNLGRGIQHHPHGMQHYSTPNALLYPSSVYAGHPSVVAALRDAMHSDIAKTIITKDGFQLCLDVHQFAPKEITVKTVENSIVVQAKHEERQDEHGYISRQFTRRYALPKGFNIKDVTPQLSSDGILTIKAPPENKALDQGNVRILQIQQTGPARLNVDHKEPSKDDDLKVAVDKKTTK